jgi:hypothetical protein
MVVGYAMALPYLLTLYQLHLQFARTVDMEKLQSALIDVERHLDTLEGILENKLQRAVTMLQNAYGEGKQVSARIRASAQSVQMSEGGEGEISTELAGHPQAGPAGPGQASNGGSGRERGDLAEAGRAQGTFPELSLALVEPPQ